ncbi:MAG: hypothetical protein QXN77_05185, partial [Candidatus Caldarchaeum sp.]
YLRMVYLGEAGVEELAVTRSVSGPLESYGRSVKHVEAAKMLKRAGASVSPGQSVSYVVKHGAGVPLQLLRSRDYDEEYYVEFLRRGYETVVSPFSTLLQRSWEAP